MAAGVCFVYGLIIVSFQ